MSDLTLTGAIPGLLRRGSPVRTANSRNGVPDIVTHYPNGVHCMTVFEGLTDQRLAALDLTDPTGRYHALLWLRERGHELRWAEDEAEVLAWSVLSVARGGRPIAGIKSLVLDETRRAALAAGYALRSDDGALTLPPLPEVPRGE